MKTRLLKRLRREAKKYVKILVTDNGRFIIKNTNWCYGSYFFENKRDEWCFGDYVNHFDTIDEAKKLLSLARNIYIMDIIIRVKREKDVELKWKLVEGL